MSVSFLPPPSDGGQLVSAYAVVWRPAGGAWTWFAESMPAVSPLVVTGLAPGTAYEFMVAGWNGVGLGAWSWSVSATPTGPPVPPQAPVGLSTVGGNGSVTVFFSPPPADGGAAVSDYVVVYRQQGTSTWFYFLDPASTDPSITVTGLANGATYQFMVSALNSVGLGAWSWMTAGTPGP